MKAVPLFYTTVLCFQYLPGKELVQKGTECRHSTVVFIPVPWPPELCCGELELSLSFAAMPKGVQGPAGNKTRMGKQ